MSLSTHLPALQIVVPLMSAPICLLLKGTRACWALSFATAFACLVIAVLLLDQTIGGTVISYAVGGWPAPWGIELRVDTTNAFILTIVSLIATAVLIFAFRSITHELAPKKVSLFYTCYILCLTGLLGMSITGDAFNLFVFLEVSSLSTYAMISVGQDRRALVASYQYLIMGTLGATFYLIGIGLLYMMTGTLNMADLAERLPALFDTRTVRAALAFLTVGISLKLALFPLHLWLPNAYAYAPSAVTAFLAGTATKVAIYVLLRVFFTIFGVAFAFGDTPLDEILLILAMAAILIASVIAIFQTDAKRMLAYSSVAQIGYIIAGISLGTVVGLSAGLIHMFNHAIIKTALFIALGCVVYQIGSAKIADFAGLGKRMPWTMAAIVAGGISLIGVPLTSGFVSKWYLVLGALDQGLWMVAVVVLIGSLLAVIYVWRIVEAAYFRPCPEHVKTGEAPLSMLLPAWGLVLLNFYFGIDSRLSLGVSTHAASQLLGVSP